MNLPALPPFPFLTLLIIRKFLKSKSEILSSQSSKFLSPVTARTKIISLSLCDKAASTIFRTCSRVGTSLSSLL